MKKWGRTQCLGDLRCKKRLLHTCTNLRNPEIFFSGARLAQHCNKSPEKICDEPLAVVNHGELKRARNLWKEIKKQREEGAGNMLDKGNILVKTRCDLF